MYLARCLVHCPKSVNSYYFASISTIMFDYFSNVAICIEFSFYVYSTFNEHFRDIHVSKAFTLPTVANFLGNFCTIPTRKLLRRE